MTWTLNLPKPMSSSWIPSQWGIPLCANPSLAQITCRSDLVRTLAPDALYIHRSAEEQIGALRRILVFAARQIVGDVDDNMLKIPTAGKTLAFLKYEIFDEDAHPGVTACGSGVLPAHGILHSELPKFFKPAYLSHTLNR
jgi:hypothetical protein